MAISGSRTKVRLIASDDERPRVPVEPGKTYEVVVTSIVDSDLAAVDAETAEGSNLRPARLCGSRSTCVAIVEVEAE
jgi:hypothetical protein